MEPPTRSLQVCVDEDDESDFRVLINGNTIKYITVPAGTLSSYDMCFSQTFMSLLPPFPPGDWNHASLSRDPTSGQLHFDTVETQQLPGVQSIWHPNKYDYLELKLGERLKSGIYNTVLESSSESVVKFASFEWEVAAIDHETTVYQWISGTGIGPAFQGHVTEHGRVIGFILEKVLNARRADPEDLELCQAALAKLHALGIKHGDVNRHNILICDGSATLIDFECATKCTDQNELNREMQNLVAQLEDASWRGAVILETLEDAVPGQGGNVVERMEDDVSGRVGNAVETSGDDGPGRIVHVAETLEDSSAPDDMATLEDASGQDGIAVQG